MTETQIPIDRERESRLSVRQIVSFIVSLAVAAALTTIGLSLALPYKPTTVDVYEILPNIVCPGHETRVRTGYNVTKPILGTVTGFSAESIWFKKGAPDRIASPDTPYPFDGTYGYYNKISPVARFAPNDPGVWYLETILTTHGKQAFRLARDEIRGIRSNPVTVLPFSDPRCEVVTSGG